MPRCVDHRHRGAVLLTMLTLLLVATTYGWFAASTAPQARTRNDRVTEAAMATVRDALIARAARDDERPGSLPCPDLDADGDAELFAGTHCKAYVGRLPWKTLDIPEPVDGNGDGLWYALSRGLRDHPSAQPVNPQTALELTLDGMPDIAAIVFSAGPPLPDQRRRPSNTVSDYLDGDNADGNHAYLSGPASAAFNDRLLPITRAELFRVVNKRVLGEIRGPDRFPAGPTFGLRAYFAQHADFPLADTDFDGYGDTMSAGRLPFNEIDLHQLPAPPAPPYTWLTANAWLPLVSYQRTANDGATVAIGSATLNVRPCPRSPCDVSP